MPAVELETAKQLFYCKGCDYQFSVTSGTVFKDVIVSDESVLYNQGLPVTQRAKRQTAKHKAEGEGYVRYENGFMVTTDTLESAFSLFKCGIVGWWHQVSPKHRAAYLNEMRFRVNRRKSHTLFIDTLRHVVTTPVLTFERLTA